MKQKGHTRRQAGQIIIILLLGMLVALTIGLAIVQNSSTDLSFSTKSEQSSRAFSAAEAGIEYALLQGSDNTTINLQNEANAEVDVSDLLPLDVFPSIQVMEYPPISRSKVAQFWLAYPGLPQSPVGAVPTGKYTRGQLDVYWGNCGTDCPVNPLDKPAIEVTVILYRAPTYYRDCLDPAATNECRFLLDSDSTRISNNKFTLGSCSSTGTTVNTILQSNSRFYCNARLDIKPASTDIPILVRIRPLYSDSPQKIAIGSVMPDQSNGRFPPQISIVTSTGTSGQTERVLKGFRAIKVIPNLFDYGVFSVPLITK